MSLPEINGGKLVSIRRATSDDCAGILSCLAAAFEPYRESYTPDAYVDTVLIEETVRKRLSTMAVFVANDANRRVVGTIACQVVGDGKTFARDGRPSGAAQHRSCEAIARNRRGGVERRGVQVRDAGHDRAAETRGTFLCETGVSRDRAGAGLFRDVTV